MTRKQRAAVVMAICGAWGAAPAQADPVGSDGSIFSDEFNGNSIDTAKWNANVSGGAHSFVSVGGGIATIHSGFTDLDSFITTQPGQLSFGAATEWVYEMRFRVQPLSPAAQTDGQGMNTPHPREVALLTGNGDVWLTLLEASDPADPDTMFTIGWGGFLGPTDVAPLAAGATDINRQQFYKLVAHHRTDNEIDFYLDDTLIGTRTAFGAAPPQLTIGDPWGVTAGIVDVDYLRIGAPTPVPEPASLGLIGLGVLTLTMRRR